MKRTLLVLGMVLALAMTSMANVEPTSADAEITSPTAGEVIYGDTLYLEAMSGTAVSVNVAVRETTEADGNCSWGTTNVLYRDVSGDLKTDASGVYSDEIDISEASPGLYCFAFDPADAERISVKFYIVDLYVKAGGVVDATAFELDFAKRGNGTHAFEGWAADAGSAGILGEFTLNYRAGEECAYTPGNLAEFSSVVMGAPFVQLVGWDSANPAPECDRDGATDPGIWLLNSGASDAFPRGGIFTYGELQTEQGEPLYRWVPLTHGNVHIYSRQ